MKHLLRSALLLVTTAALPAVAAPLVIEAEQAPGAGDSVRADPTARGGSYATNPRAWNPVVKVPVPAEHASLTLWARVRGGPFLAKGTPGGKQADLAWNYAKPTEWTWHKFGDFERARLGAELIIIRGASLADDGGIDTVVLSPDPGFDPARSGTAEPFRPPAPPTPASASASAPNSSLPAPRSTLPPITVPSGGWFPPGWVPRRTLFREQHAADQGAVVFVGDSITQGFNAAKAFPALKTANRGISGDLVQNLRHRLQEDVIDLQPRAVVLLMGTNDAKDGKPAAQIVRDLRAAAEKIHAASPDTPVIVSRLLPRAPRAGQPKEAERLPAAILEVNKLIDALPAELPWLRLADPFTPMAREDGSPRPEFFGDGVHPNSAGNAALAAAFTAALRSAGVQ